MKAEVVSGIYTDKVPYTSLFSRFLCFFKRSISWVLIFVGVIFVVMNRLDFVYSAVRGYNVI